MQVVSKPFAAVLSCAKVKPAPIWFLAMVCMADVSFAQQLKVVEEERTIVVTQADKVVVTYNKVSPPAPTGIDPIYERSGCLHPVGSPQGKFVTAMFPFDHAHQQGIFSAWVNTTYDGRAVDFWNLAGRTGRVLHERVIPHAVQNDTNTSTTRKRVGSNRTDSLACASCLYKRATFNRAQYISTFQTAEVAGFEVDLLHRVETQPPVDVLRERWKVSVYPTDGTYHCFDLETEQTALTAQALIINEYHYGGIVLRGPTRWLTAKDSDAHKQSDLTIDPSEFLNNLGSDRVKGNHEHANWVALRIVQEITSWNEVEVAGAESAKPRLTMNPNQPWRRRLRHSHPTTRPFDHGWVALTNADDPCATGSASASVL